MERLQILRDGRFVYSDIGDLKKGDVFRVVEGDFIGRERVAEGDAYRDTDGEWAVRVRQP